MILILFWISLGLIVYSYVGYPLLIALLTPFFPKLKRDLRHTPTLSVLIPAYNEEASIAKKVNQTLALDYPAGKLEVVVVSDGSSDRTNEIMEGFTDPRVRFFARSRGGKTQAQNFGVTECRGEIVVFSDATSIYKSDALRQLAAYFVDPSVGAVSGVCRFFDGKGSPSGLGQILYGGYEQTIRTCQSRIYTATACSGPIYATRRELYVPLPGNSCSDMTEPLEIVRRGARVVYALEAQASEATTPTARAEFRMRVRVTAQGLLGLASAGSMLYFGRGFWITFQLISHKGLRYFLAAPLAMLFASSAALASSHPWIGLLFLAQAGFYGMALAASVVKLGKLFNLPLYFCIGNAAVVTSLFEVLRGNHFTTWETVRK